MIKLEGEKKHIAEILAAGSGSFVSIRMLKETTRNGEIILSGSIRLPFLTDDGSNTETASLRGSRDPHTDIAKEVSRTEPRM